MNISCHKFCDCDVASHDEAHVQRIAKQWRCFAAGEAVDAAILRPFVLASWQRSRAAGVPLEHPPCTRLASEMVESALRTNAMLLEVGEPLAQSLISFMPGTGCQLILTDGTGTALLCLSHGKTSCATVGNVYSESATGTNAVSLCLQEQRPLYVAGPEHYCLSNHDLFCSAAPIHDAQGCLLGCLSMAVKVHHSTFQTLGMVVAAASAMAEQVKLRRLLAEQASLLSLIQEGVLLLNAAGNITNANATAMRLLGMTGEDMGSSLNYLVRKGLSLKELIHSPAPLLDQERTLLLRHGSVDCVLSSTALPAMGNTGGGVLISLREKKRMRKFVQRVAGNTAHFTFEQCIGKSGLFQNALHMGRIASQGESTVLLLGESGTGKELFAQAIHNGSHRRDGPFVAVNCAALPRELVVSELFGYEGGSFTGAKKEGQPGKFELADGGTIFLDEIGDMPLDAQASLLRVLEGSEVLRVGGKEPRRVDIRVIAATHQNMEALVAEKAFRADLFYRVNIFSIHLPALRERGEDIALLVQHCLEMFSTKLRKNVHRIDEGALACLRQHHWPGNVRELLNCLERAVNVCPSDTISLEHLPPLGAGMTAAPVLQHHGSRRHARRAEKSTDGLDTAHTLLRQSKKEAIGRALRETQGNIRKAATLLGIARSTLYLKMQKYEINP